MPQTCTTAVNHFFTHINKQLYLMIKTRSRFYQPDKHVHQWQVNCERYWYLLAAKYFNQRFQGYMPFNQNEPEVTQMILLFSIWLVVFSNFYAIFSIKSHKNWFVNSRDTGRLRLYKTIPSSGNFSFYLAIS